MAFYDEMAGTAAELLTEFGATSTLTRVTTGEYDPATGTAATTTETEDVKAAVFDYPAQLVDGLVIQRGDKRVIAEVKTLVPQAVDKFTWQGEVYQIVNVKALAPAGVGVLNTLQVRK